MIEWLSFFTYIAGKQRFRAEGSTLTRIIAKDVVTTSRFIRRAVSPSNA